MEKEIWKAVVRYVGIYQVSNHGRVRSVKTGKLKAQKTREGQGPVVHLYKRAVRRQLQVNRIVLQAFDKDTDSFIVKHKDGDKTNCHLSNLEWARNTNLPIKYGKDHPRAVLDEKQVLAIRADKRRQVVIADEYGIYPSTVSKIKNNKHWKHL